MTLNNPSTNLSQARIGIDIGRVLISVGDGRHDTSFLSGGEEAAMATPPMQDAIQCVKALSRRTGGNIWLVSKCGERIAGRSRRWLARWRFFAQVEVDPSHLRFCKKRPDKAIHARQLRLTHFVDDRADVLVHLRDLVPHLYLFGPQEAAPPIWARHVKTWQRTVQAIVTDAGRIARQAAHV